MPSLLEHLKRRSTEAPLLRLPVQENPDFPSQETINWANETIGNLKGVKDKRLIAAAIGKFTSDLSQVDSVHAFAIRAFEQDTSRPYLSVTGFTDVNVQNQEPFKAFLLCHRELWRKINGHVGTGSRTSLIKPEDVGEVLGRFIKPERGAEGKVLGAVHFQRS